MQDFHENTYRNIPALKRVVGKFSGARRLIAAHSLKVNASVLRIQQK